MSQDELNRATRRAKRVRECQGKTTCDRCKRGGWESLQLREGSVLCYECLKLSMGQHTSEQHHIIGRANDPTTVDLPGNLHRKLSDLQRDRPESLRTNIEGDPLLWIVAYLASTRDFFAVMVDVLAWVTEFLLNAVPWLREQLGDRWWERIPAYRPPATT